MFDGKHNTVVLRMKIPFLGSLRSETAWRGRRLRDDGVREANLKGDGNDSLMEFVGETVDGNVS
jgi:hypothetical protein